jgi:hypothetical protein
MPDGDPCPCPSSRASLPARRAPRPVGQGTTTLLHAEGTGQSTKGPQSARRRRCLFWGKRTWIARATRRSGHSLPMIPFTSHHASRISDCAVQCSAHVPREVASWRCTPESSCSSRAAAARPTHRGCSITSCISDDGHSLIFFPRRNFCCTIQVASGGLEGRCLILTDHEQSSRQAFGGKATFRSKNTQNILHSNRHIESLDACMKY